MRQVRFVGDPKEGGDGPKVARPYGLVLERGVWCDVPDDHIAWPRFVGNNHYEVRDKPRGPGRPRKTPPPEVPPAMADPCSDDVTT